MTAPARTLTAADFVLARVLEQQRHAEAILATMAADPGSFVVLGLAHPELAAGDCPSDLGEFDPARVLAQCEALRAVVEAVWDDNLRIEGEWGMGRSREELDALGDVPEAVRALASVWRDHPAFDPAWSAS